MILDSREKLNNDANGQFINAPYSYTKIKENWLTRKLRPNAVFVAFFGLMILALGSMMAWSDFLGAGEWMVASGQTVFARGEYWRAWTSLFVHSDLGHFLSNSVLFFAFSFLLYGHFGFWVFPLTSFFFEKGKSF